MFIDLAFVPIEQITTGYSAIQSITPKIKMCDHFNDYFSNTWIHGQFPIDLWNHFRDERPRTNNFCEGYNSRLRKRAANSHLNIFELIMVLQKEQIHPETLIMQKEDEIQPAKKQKRDV